MGVTDEQARVIEAKFDDILVVNAYAGTGKTFTMKNFAARRTGKRILYLAFNKAMAVEASAKFRGMGHVEAKTIHSLAFQACGKKYLDRLGDIRPNDLSGLVRSYSSAALLLDGLNAYMTSDFQTPQEYARMHGVDDFSERMELCGVGRDEFIRKLEILWGKILNDDSVPFPHGAYLKLFQLTVQDLGYDYVLVDEAQDVNPAMQAIVLTQRKSKKVFIGDSYQQIYAWNGAIDSLRNLAPKGQVLHLTQSFRCPQPIANEANKYLSILGAPKPFRGVPPRAPDTKVEGVAYLARSNAGLFTYVAKNMDKQIGFLGGLKNYGFEKLVDIANLRFNKPDKIRDPFLQHFDSFAELEDYAVETGDAQTSARVRVVKRYGGNVYEIYRHLKEHEMPENKAEIVLTTSHKSKGQEYDLVSLGSDFFVVEDALQLALKTQGYGTPVDLPNEELNLLYVAFTRSKLKLDCPQNLILSDSVLDQVTEFVKKGWVTNPQMA